MSGATVRSLPLPGTRRNSLVLEDRLQIKENSGQLLSLIGANHGGVTQYIQLHESVGAPLDGAVPIFSFPVGAGSVFGLDTPLQFSGGLWVCNSTTPATLTAGAEDCWFLAQEI